MSKKITIDNFLKMNPDNPEFTSKNTNYLIAGANPTYYLDSSNIQEVQSAPLTASLSWTQSSASLDGNIIAMCAGSTQYSYPIYLMTTTSRVYGVTVSGGLPTGVTSLGFPSGSTKTLDYNDGDMTWVNNQLYVTYAGAGYLVYRYQSNTWNSIPSSNTAFGTCLEPFLQYCMYTNNGVITKIDPSYNILTGINLGTGWNILNIKNYNNKYLAIAGQNGQNYTQNYIHLWNGYDSLPNYSIKVNGQFIDMKVVDGTLYVAAAVSTGATTLYYLKGTTLVEAITPQYSSIDTNGAFYNLVRPNCCFSYLQQIGIRLATTSDLTYPLMLYGKDLDGGVGQFIITSGFAIYGNIVGADGLQYGFNGQSLYYYPITSTSYQNIVYKSQWIPVKNLSGIDVYYDTPPQSGTDAINVTIYGKGEDIISGNSTTILTSITPTTILNNTRTRLDTNGFTGDMVLVVLTTVNTGTWRPIIRNIELITE